MEARFKVSGTGDLALSWGATFITQALSRPHAPWRVKREEKGFFWRTKRSKKLVHLGRAGCNATGPPLASLIDIMDDYALVMLVGRRLVDIEVTNAAGALVALGRACDATGAS